MNRNDLYRGFNEIDDEILEASEQSIKIKEANIYRRSRWSLGKKMIATVATICLLFFGSVTALAAANVNFAYEAMYFISPYFAQKLKPINKSCVSNGIEMTVISASIENETAEVLIALTDLEGDRIDATIDLFDSYSIRNSYDSVGTCRLEHYDAKEGIAYFSVSLQQMDEKKFSNDKINFSVSKLLSQKQQFADVIPNLTLSNIDTTPTIDNDVNLRGASNQEQVKDVSFLKPAAIPLASPVEGVDITGFGYIDGTLHIQAYYHNITKTDNHGWITLRSVDGTSMNASYSTSFWDDTQSGSYQEYVFHIPEEKLASYQVVGEFITCGQMIEGDWEVTFPLSDAS